MARDFYETTIALPDAVGSLYTGNHAHAAAEGQGGYNAAVAGQAGGVNVSRATTCTPCGPLRSATSASVARRPADRDSTPGLALRSQPGNSNQLDNLDGRPWH
jgi:hypothetical protein